MVFCKIREVEVEGTVNSMVEKNRVFCLFDVQDSISFIYLVTIQPS
jgi:hypothetical protein